MLALQKAGAFALAAVFFAAAGGVLAVCLHAVMQWIY